MNFLDARAESRKEKAAFARIRKSEYQYGIRLRRIARAVGEIVEAFPAGDPESLHKIQNLLRKYAELITPWAKVVAASMLADVSRRDEKNWAEITKSMGYAMREEIRNAP